MKKAVYVDKLYYQTLVQAHKLALPYLNQVCEKYQELSMGEITPEVLTQIAAGDYDKIKNAISTNVEAELKKTGLTNRAMLDNLRENVFIEFEDFKTFSMEKIKRFKDYRFYGNTGHFPIETDHFTLSGEKAFLTDDDLRRLQDDFCTTYLETDLQNALWEKLQTAASALQEVTTIMKENRIEVPLFFFDGNPGFLSTDGEEIEVHGELMDYRIF